MPPKRGYQSVIYTAGDRAMITSRHGRPIFLFIIAEEFFVYFKELVAHIFDFVKRAYGG